MINIFLGLILIISGTFLLITHWYISQHILGVIFLILISLGGVISLLSGLRTLKLNQDVIIINGRDVTIDILRGLAIFTMIAANMAAYALIQPHPFPFRLYGTFAAPLFITISGAMVVFTTKEKGHNFGYFLKRGIILIVVAALIDILIWGIRPFTTVDVLYLIGISLPIAYIFQAFDNIWQWVIVIAIFLMTPVFQRVFGYADFPVEYYLWGKPTLTADNQTSILNHWFIDGFFPIFPWLGFSLLGVIIGRIRWLREKYYSFANKHALITAKCILVSGIILWILYPGVLLIRNGYSELFYPPTLGYIFCAVGLIILLFVLIDSNPQRFARTLLGTIGKHALLAYILHLIIIKYIIAYFWPNQPLLPFLIIYLATVVVIFFILKGVNVLKRP